MAEANRKGTGLEDAVEEEEEEEGGDFVTNQFGRATISGPLWDYDSSCINALDSHNLPSPSPKPYSSGHILQFLLLPTYA